MAVRLFQADKEGKGGRERRRGRANTVYTVNMAVNSNGTNNRRNRTKHFTILPNFIGRILSSLLVALSIHRISRDVTCVRVYRTRCPIINALWMDDEISIENDYIISITASSNIFTIRFPRF